MKPVQAWMALILALLIAILILRRDLSVPNVRIFTEMADSPAYQSQSVNPVFHDGRTLQPPVIGTIPRGHIPFPYGSTKEERRRAGLELTNPIPRDLATLERGRESYGNFCQHCHGPSGHGDGGVAQRIPAFAMSIVGASTRDLPDGEIFHILTYGQNNMPAHGPQIPQPDRWKILHFLRDIQNRESAYMAKLGISVEKDPRVETLVSVVYGSEVYESNCKTCHGPQGARPLEGIPTLNLARVLAVADDEYYSQIITHGRKGTSMPAWGEILTRSQIKSLVLYIRSWQPHEPDRSQIAKALGNLDEGRSLFRGNCAPCHGGKGDGGVGVSLNTDAFLSMASDEFLRDTITRGRNHTGMPSGYQFSPHEISGILAYLRSWSPAKHQFSDVAALLPDASDRIGKKVYVAKCASCHGKNGDGGIGPTLASQEFLSLASDKYLYRAICDGRPGTAMPAWRQLSAEDVADLMKFLRSWQTAPAKQITGIPHKGRPEFGRLLYEQACISCHGPEGRGGVGTQLANKVFLESASDDFLYEIIAQGKTGTAMRGFIKGAAGGALMEMGIQDIDHIIAYLRDLQKHPRVEPMKRARSSMSVAWGRDIFENKASCAKCHGYSGEGASGPALGNPDFLAVASDGYMVGTIVLGREDTGMPSFYRGGTVLLNQLEVEAVVSYVRSFEDKPLLARKLVDMSEESVSEGRELYQRNCASCHGSEGKGPANNKINGYAPSLNNAEFLAAADDGLLLATIALGRPGTPMRSFAKGSGGISDLSAGEIKRIVSFVRSWQEVRP